MTGPPFQAPTLSAARRGSVYKPVAGIPFRSMPAKSPEDPEAGNVVRPCEVSRC